MRSNVFLKTLYDMRRALFWWGLGLFLLSLYYITFYPSMQESSADLQEMLDRMPDSMRALMGGEVDLTSVEGFLSLEAFSFFYPILLLAFAVSYGAGIIGSEEENGTLDLLLATPVPRWRVILEKFGALVVFTVIVLLTIYLGFLAGALAVDIEGMDNVFILQGVLNMLPITLFFAALALFLTALRSGGRGLALGVTLGLAAISYLIFSMAEISNIPLWLRRLSPWHYYNGANLAQAGINAGHTALLLGLTVLLVGGSLWAFQRRDVGV